MQAGTSSGEHSQNSYWHQLRLAGALASNASLILKPTMDYLPPRVLSPDANLHSEQRGANEKQLFVDGQPSFLLSSRASVDLR